MRLSPRSRLGLYDYLSPRCAKNAETRLKSNKFPFAAASVFCLSVACFTLVSVPVPANAPRVVWTDSNSLNRDSYNSPVHLANLENQSINESSGIAASRRNANIFWTHNDSGDGPFVYAFDRQGKNRGVWRVVGAEAQDWEDIAVGPGPRRGQSYLYIGDIGDNSRKRDQITVYRVTEPRITSKDASSTHSKPNDTETAETIRLKYPDGKHDAEALLVHPLTADLYVVTKVMASAAGIYKLPAPWPKSGTFTLRYIGEFRFPDPFLGFITGGDISPDGNRVVLCDYVEACELVLPGKRGAPFDEIWKETPVAITIGDYRGVRRQGEAICYRADGKALLATSEGRPCPLIEIARHN
jgi:hypothetical protein